MPVRNQGRVIGVGYGSAQGRAELEHLMTTIEGAIIADIRLRPFSRLPGWSGAALARKWPGRYHHLPALGNRRYRERLALAGHQPPPVELVDEAAGMAALRRLLSVSPLVILLCGCADAARCHRQIVLEKVHSDQHGVGSYSGAT